MLFSSTVFIFLFLPVVTFCYYVLCRKSRTLQNLFLVFASLFFYAWGEPKFVCVMLFSVLTNWLFGLSIDKVREKKTARFIIAITVIFNLSILFVFKYLSFTVDNINTLFKSNIISIPDITLPIGISFFTFQAMSYVIDVYRENGKVQKNIINVALYISFFPQLIAGPIVRYETIAEQMTNRIETKDDVCNGFARFLIGLGKKVMLANSFAVIADRIFTGFHLGDEMSVASAWLGAVCYTLQIYYDFSGYSDMAIGLGRMFGFHFLENFDYPYISVSITEFWRRWHISLGTWFRDYVYIPLGGSRVKKPRMIFNLFAVWLLTGIWHGANWTFICWGLMYFVLLSIEKLTGFYKTARKGIRPILWLYTMFFVIIGWVIFRSPDLKGAGNYLLVMCGSHHTFLDGAFIANFRQIIIYFIFGILFSFPFLPYLKRKIGKNAIVELIYILFMITIFVLSLSSIVSSSYNPFIYFNF